MSNVVLLEMESWKKRGLKDREKEVVAVMAREERKRWDFKTEVELETGQVTVAGRMSSSRAVNAYSTGYSTQCSVHIIRNNITVQ